MLDEYKIHNQFWNDRERFLKEDPHLSFLQHLAYVHPLDWWKNIDWKEPGILILTGGRQIGKTTSLKLLTKHILQKSLFHQRSIFYFPCDLILDVNQLVHTLRFFLDSIPQGPFLLLIDEITFVPHWDRAIKALADEGRFKNGFCLITGSDSVILKEAAQSFPGRRGQASKVDFHLLSLDFHDYVSLVQSSILKNPQENLSLLFQLFSNYLQCGGFLRAINDWHQKGHITEATYATFEQWIRGDILKRGKNEEHLCTILKTIYEVGVTQNSYSGLTQKAGVMSKETFFDYCRLLRRMDILFTLEAFDQNTLRGFPKKARKFHFCDPFIRKTIEKWLFKTGRINKQIDESEEVEACIAGVLNKKIFTYYIKAEGEIDLVIVQGKQFFPIEVKWGAQLRPSDLKQLKKYSSSIILTKLHQAGEIEGIRCLPVPLFLIEYHHEFKQFGQ